MVRIGFRLALLVALLLALNAAPAAADPCPGPGSEPACQALGAFGNVPPPGQAIMRQPQALALDSGGDLFVGDRWGYAFQRFDGAKSPSGAWGEYGQGDGRFGAIGGLAVGPDGAVYVLDIDQNRIQKWVADGTGGYRFERSWGDFDIRFKGDVAIGPGPRVYVADTYNQRVAWYDTDGRFEGQIGQTDVPGSDATHLRYPQGVTVDADGNVYVADDRNNRVQKFSPAGVLLASIGQPGDLNRPYDVGVDAKGNVYVADNMDHRVAKFAPDSTKTSYSLTATWGGRGDQPGQLLTPRSIVVQPDGTNFVADTGNGRIQVFDAGGTLQTAFGVNGRDGGRLTGPMGLALTADGSILSADAPQYRIQRLSPDGANATGFWGSHGDGDDQLWLAEGVAPAADGGSWVADTGNDRVQHFDAAGNSTGVIPGFSAPRGIATDAAGNVYVADTGNHRIVKLDPSGAQQGVWTDPGMAGPADVAVAPSGTVVAPDATGWVFAFGQSGAVVGKWDGTGTNPMHRGPEALVQPSGVGVDAAGDIYVSDSGLAAVEKYAPDGTWLARFGSSGHGVGQFWWGGPRDVVVAADGSVLASDPYANEIERFSVPGPAAAPVITPGRAFDVGATSARVGATLATHGVHANYWVEYGPTPAHGAHVDVASATADGPLAVGLAGLAPRRACHYRFVAANAGGITYGPDQTFTTTRALELRVSAQRLRSVVEHGVAIRVRPGERLSATIQIRAGRHVIGRATRRLRRGRWQTVHVRLGRRARLTAPALLRVTAAATSPRGSATARLRIRP